MIIVELRLIKNGYQLDTWINKFVNTIYRFLMKKKFTRKERSEGNEEIEFDEFCEGEGE